jgi:hypothetical protein
VGAGGGELERGGHIARELLNPTSGDTGVVQGKIISRGELCGGSSDIGASTDIEVAAKVCQWEELRRIS